MVNVGRAVVEVAAELDAGSFGAVAKAANKELDRFIEDVSIEGTLDVASFIAAAKQANFEVQAALEQAKIQGDLDTESFQTAVRQANLELRRINNSVKVGADIDRAAFTKSIADANGILRRGLSKAGSDSGNGFADGFSTNARRGILGAAADMVSGFGRAFQGGIVSNPYVIGGVIAAISAAMPLAGSIAAGLFITAFGAGIAGLGLVFAAQNAGVKKAFSDLGSDIAAQMRTMTKPLQGVLLQVVDTAADVFQGFAPALTQAFAAMAPALSGFVQQLGRAFLQLEPAIAPVTQAFSGILDALGPQLVGLFGQISASLVNMANSVDPQVFASMLTGLLEIIPALLNLVTWLTNVQAIMQPWYSAIASAIGQVVSAFGELNTSVGGASTWGTIFAGVATGITIAATVIATAIRAVATQINIVRGVVSGVVNFIQAAWARLGPITQTAWGVVTAAVQRGVAAVRVAIQTLRNVGAIVRTAWTLVRTVTVTVWSTVRAAVVRAVNAIRNGIRNGVNAARNAVTNAWNAVRNTTIRVWNAVRNAVVKAVNAIRNGIQRGLAAARAAVVRAWNAVRSATVTAWNRVSQAVSEGVSKAVKFVKELPGKAESAIRSGVGQMKSAGAALIEGVRDGIISKAKSIASAAVQVVKDAIAAAKKAAKIFSPSRITRDEIGSPLAEGIAEGITRGTGSAELAARGLIDGVTQALRNASRSINWGPLSDWQGGKAGKRLMETLADGIKSGTPKAIRTALGAIEDMGKLIDKQVRKDIIGKDVAEGLRRQLNAMGDIIRQSAARVAARAKFGKELSNSLMQEFSLEGFAAGGIEGVIEGANTMAAQIRAFGRKLTALGKAGIPAPLIREVAGLGSSKGSVVADQLLDSTAAQRAALRKAYAELNAATKFAGNRGGDVLYGTNRAIAKDLQRQINELRKMMKGTYYVSREADDREKKDRKDRKDKGKNRNLGTGDAITVNQNYYGPQTGNGRLRELSWTLRYATKARRRADSRTPGETVIV